MRGKWKYLKNILHVRFHNRLMLSNTIIFLLVAYLFAFAAAKYYIQLETVKQLQRSRDALSALCNYYDSKYDEFTDLVFPLFQKKENYNAISQMLESESDRDYEENAFLKQDIIKVMQDITVRDSDVTSILIYKNLTGARYIYTVKSNTLELVGPEYPFFAQLKDKTNQRILSGTRIINYRTSPSLPVYGIGGTIRTGNFQQGAGQFLIVYDTNALKRIYKQYIGRTRGRFILASVNSDIIFDSQEQYTSEQFSEMKVLLSGQDSAAIDGKDCYIQTVQGLKNNYVGANIVPKEMIQKNNMGIRFLIFGVLTVMAIVCAVLYSIAGSFISRRIKQMEDAMKYVGKSNLSYRLPIYGKHDEFEYIAIKFNSMCDELQQTINHKYISEIKKKNAEMKALQSGINPHFLYNTLESIRIKAIDDGNRDVAEMIVLLANIYRGIVHDNTFITIRKEVNICSMYLSIFSLRYANNLDCEIEVEPCIMEYGIPKNLLQPIIENCFVHGIRDDKENNKLTISGFMRDGDIWFSFEDNGRGLSKERLREIQESFESCEQIKESGYGLPNVNERIRIIYGEDYGLQLESEENFRTRVSIRIKAMTCIELENSINIREFIV